MKGKFGKKNPTAPTVEFSKNINCLNSIGTGGVPSTTITNHDNGNMINDI